MKDIFHRFLFAKHILVRENASTDGYAMESLYALGELCGIKIISGAELANRNMISFAAGQLGVNVPKPFYTGFPDTVRNLSPDKLLFDQMVHYTVTYGFGDFSTPGHSVFEEQFERMAFRGRSEVKEFVILREEEAVGTIREAVADLLKGSRPLNDSSFSMVKEAIGEYGCEVSECASKNTAIRLLAALRDMQFARFLSLSDVIKVADEINFTQYFKNDIREMNWRNQDRKFLAGLIDMLCEGARANVRECYEKKALWSGLLHHVHYKAKTAQGKAFVRAMRGRENGSVYSAFEKELKNGNIREAIHILKEGKGNGAFLRNLDYLLSRCKTKDQWDYVLQEIGDANGILLLQLIMKYAAAAKKEKAGYRTFRFNRHNMSVTHREKPEESCRRGTFLGAESNRMLEGVFRERAKAYFRGRIKKVYIDPAMKEMALPLQENASQGGLGVLAKGSRLPLDLSKIIRAFTYWEKVDDIDLSVFGLSEEGEQIEFSWRTMAENQSDAILFSGDQTSGYNGGSEYFDINVPAFTAMYPKTRYVIFCDNVFSGKNFATCFCKAGYMIREDGDLGEVFEPKTVKSSFQINCESTYAFLFGIDLKDGKFVWLNMANQGGSRVAGDNYLDFLMDCFDYTSVMNVYSFFEMLADTVTKDPDEADVIVSDTLSEEGRNVIRSYDFEKIMTYMQ